MEEDDATMATKWDEEMTNRFDQLQQTLTDEIRTQFVTLGGQLETRLEQRLGERLEARIDKRLAASEERLTAHISQTIQVQGESLRDIVKTAADNYGGVLGRIDRELGEFRQEWRAQAEDTTRVLANHHERLLVLEATGSNPGELTARAISRR